MEQRRAMLEAHSSCHARSKFSVDLLFSPAMPCVAQIPLSLIFMLDETIFGTDSIRYPVLEDRQGSALLAV